MKEAVGNGYSLDAATQDALNQLCAQREEVEIEPLHTGSKGFLGFGRKPAQVRARLRPDDRIRATVFLRSILTHLNIETSMQVLEEGELMTIKLGEEASPLIGHRGQTLESLQYLVARYLNEDKEEWRKVEIDINNYRNRREDNLRQMAERMAEQVIRTKREIRTEPLPAPERRIIHLALKENPAVTTFSIGNGVRRRVVITSTDKPAQPPHRHTHSPRRDGGRGRGGSGGGRNGGSGGGRRGGRPPSSRNMRPPSMQPEKSES